MHNSEQIREFFRKMADGRGLNSEGRSLLPGSESVAADRLDRENPRIGRSVTFNDFGVGLPPLAHG